MLMKDGVTGRQVPRKLQILLVIAGLTALGCAAAGSPNEASSAPSEGLPEVIVKAQRAELEPRVSKFVYGIAGLENDEGIPRWRIPACPYVAGIPQQEGEFAVGRIAEVARTAGVPLGGEHCRPNLIIIVTPDPKVLFVGMTDKTRLLTFGGAHTRVIDDFIATSRPVKVWYKTLIATPEGEIMGDAERTDVDEAAFGIPPVAAETAYARHNVIWIFSRILVVVDQTRLQLVTRGQFADYIAMVSLAELRPGAHLGDAPTILKLFDGTPQDAPPGMSAWDQAFLKSVYSTSQTSKGQRAQITSTIVREIAH